MIRVKNGMLRRVDIEDDGKKSVLEYRTDVRDDRIVFVVSLDDEDLYVGDEIENIDSLFVSFGSLFDCLVGLTPKKKEKKRAECSSRLLVYNFLNNDVKGKMK